MKQKDIDKEIKKRIEEVEDGYEQLYNSGYTSGFNDAADWRIRSVWHNVEEVPDNDRIILVLRDSGHCLIAGPNNEQMEDTVKELKLNKWAYIDDLIPDEK